MLILFWSTLAPVPQKKKNNTIKRQAKLGISFFSLPLS